VKVKPAFSIQTAVARFSYEQEGLGKPKNFDDFTLKTVE